MSSKHSKQSTPRSSIWGYFTKTSDPEVVTCKICYAPVRPCGNTTNIRNHIKRNHGSMKIAEDAAAAAPKNKVPRKSFASTSSTSSTKNCDECDDDVDDPAAYLGDLAQTIVNKAQVSQSKLKFDAVEPSTSSSSSGIVDNDSWSFRSKSVTSSIGCGSSGSQSVCLKQRTMFESFADIKSYDKGGSKTRSITNALVFMLAKDNMPLNTTEKEGFIHFMKKAAPMYKIPSRTTITNLIKTKYEVLSGLVKTKLSQIEFLTITTDIWTDTVNTKSYLGMTVHFLNISNVALDSVTIGVMELSASHTANNISMWFEQLIEEWGIKKKQVVTVVTDNGSNILSAVKKTFSQEKHLPCFAHTLNLVSERALENLSDVQVLINKIKSVVTYFKHSVAASDELKKLCNYKLKQSVPTRWNSIYYMIERFILCSNYIDSVLINMRGGPTMVTADEIDLAREMLSVLRPMEVATKELCGQKYVTGSKVIPLINCLIKKTESINLSNPIALTLKQAMLDNLYKRFGRMEEISLLSVATILDPRFKTIHLNNPNSSARAIRLIKNKITEIKNSSDDTNSSSCHGSSDDDGDRHDSLWSVHTELVTKKAAAKTSEQSEERIPTDLKHYLSQPTINLGEDILKYWDQNGSMYPYLKKIVLPYLSVVATSVPSERLFSKAGNIMTEKRNRLKGEKLQQLLFLSSLDFNDWHLE